MYVVKVPFKYQSLSGKLVDAKVGDELPEFDKWPHVNKKAHLNLGWVIEETKKVESKPVEVQETRKGRSKK